MTNETIANDTHGINGTVNYGYDPVGNRLSRTSSVSGVPSQTSTYEANDRLTTDTYDNNGNTKATSGSTYDYDFENRLITHTSSVTSGFVYDGDGNRVGKTVDGITTNHLVDTNNHTGYAQVVEELQSGAVVKQFIYGHDLISQRIVGSSLSFYTYDGHGSVRQLTDATATVTDAYDYDAFGKLIYRSGTTLNDYLYSGEQFDANLGFYYLRARYMNPSSGRFLTMDSYEGSPFEPVTLHKYLYAGSNPVDRIDPSGNSLVELNIRVAVSNVLSAMSSLQAYAALLSFRLTFFASAGINFVITRGNQSVTILRNTGDSGIRAWQNLMLQSNRIVSFTESASAATSRNYPLLREFLNKTIMGTRGNPANTQWHHIVEQGGKNASRFGNAVNSTGNIVPTPDRVHTVINRFYSQVNNAPPWVRETGARTVREWMQRQTWERQYEAGLEIWKQAMTNGVITWHP